MTEQEHPVKSWAAALSTNQAETSPGEGREGRKLKTGRYNDNADTTRCVSGQTPNEGESTSTIDLLLLQFMLGSPRVFKDDVTTSPCVPAPLMIKHRRMMLACLGSRIKQGTRSTPPERRGYGERGTRRANPGGQMSAPRHIDMQHTKTESDATIWQT